ncbi:MAG: phosphoribosylformylglycinamidine synthase subunit PurL [Planctomycetaceae bacterium]|nr:phosphoribosylformylglycinamidine synthase subunit PurL [Planctomycetaceae bacterium]
MSESAMTLWEVRIQPAAGEVDREGLSVAKSAVELGVRSIRDVHSSRVFLVQGTLAVADVQRAAATLLVDTVVEQATIRPVQAAAADVAGLVYVLYKPGVTDNVADSTRKALVDLGFAVETVATGRAYQFNSDADAADLHRVAEKVLANDAIERVLYGGLHLSALGLGHEYKFQLKSVALRTMSDPQLTELSRTGQLYLSLAEMQTIQRHFRELDRDPTDIELETVAQTWSEHCSHKTLKGRIRYRDENGERTFQNMLKETIFAATQTVRKQLGADDWCVSVFEDNAGVVKFDDQFHACFKVETHNHPSAIEPYGGANTGLGGVIRDPLGTGLGAKPVLNTDVFCFAPPETPYDALPAGVLHPKSVMHGVVSGVRDYGNRMGIPTVNGAVFFDERYLGNPLVYCGTAAMLPVNRTLKRVAPGDLIVAVGGRTGRDGIHGATFSSAELTEDSETESGGAVQIGNAVAEKMVLDVILQARDKGLYRAITDCGAGGFSSAVGEMGEHTGAEVWLDRAPLKYAGLSYTEIWISEAQERMVLAVPPENGDEFQKLCAAEGVEATVIGQFTDTQQLVLKYQDQLVGEVAMAFLHDGRPPVIREAVYVGAKPQAFVAKPSANYDVELKAILGSLNVCSKHWIIRQYDHEVQSGSVVKPLVGAGCDGPSDAAVVRPVLTSSRGLVVSNGMNPRFGEFDPYWMAASAIDEAVRNCVAVGADPKRIAILDNFCWGNTERPETLGSLVRAALGCHDTAVAYGLPFISGKDSLNNEFSYQGPSGERRTVAIPSSLLISAMGQMADIGRAVTMDLKSPGNLLYLIGATKNEMGGSHFGLVTKTTGGDVPRVDLAAAPKIFAALHRAIEAGLIRSCHDLSEGGLAVTAAEMAFAGGYGIEVDLQPLVQASQLDAATLLFSESNTRFLIEVPTTSSQAFEQTFRVLSITKIGRVTTGDRMVVKIGNGPAVIDSPLADLKAAWQAPLNWE